MVSVNSVFNLFVTPALAARREIKLWTADSAWSRISRELSKERKEDTGLRL